MEASVAVDIRWRLAVPVTAEVRSHRTVAEGGEGVDLVALGVPKLGKAMEEENDWTLAFLCKVNINSICLHSPVLYPLHCPFPA